jgi:soluble epoxide hydrolase/lipid-phosphate phosphatase
VFQKQKPRPKFSISSHLSYAKERPSDTSPLPKPDMDQITSHSFQTPKITTTYLTAGPSTGPLLIFVHGWPGIAATWTPQLLAFASLGFRVVAPDTRGYGNTTASKNHRDYALEPLAADLLALLAHLGRDEAVWIGHDWGCGIVWALAAHHPEVCTGVVNMCVPYRTLEMGLDALLKLVNREIYPEAKYPYGQFDYQKFYELHGDKATKVLDADPGNTVKALFVKGRAATYGLPARTSTLIQDGGWFGGAPKAPDVPLEATVLDEPMFTALRDSLARTGFFGATAYYLNHDVNAAYAKSAVNGGVLTMPTFFIEARWDAVCATSLGGLSEPMRKYCRNLTECSIEAGHWVALDKPKEVNAALARWLATHLPQCWPGYWNSPFVSSAVKL